MEEIKILIVEDESIIAQDIKASLNKMGYIVFPPVNSGEKTIEAIANERPDIILMDIMLKGEMTGIDAANIIRQKFDIPVIFLTAYADEDTLSKAKIAEPYGYIIKPFRDKELQTTIEIALYKYEKDVKVKRERDLYHSLVENRESNDSIFVRADFRLNRVKFSDIFFVEALKDYVIINTSNNVFTTHTTMKEMIRILPIKDFIRVHRTYIVNLNKIFSIKYPELVIEGKMKVIPVGGIYRKELYSRLNQI